MGADKGQHFAVTFREIASVALEGDGYCHQPALLHVKADLFVQSEWAEEILIKPGVAKLSAREKVRNFGGGFRPILLPMCEHWMFGDVCIQRRHQTVGLCSVIVNHLELMRGRCKSPRWNFRSIWGIK